MEWSLERKGIAKLQIKENAESSTLAGNCQKFWDVWNAIEPMGGFGKCEYTECESLEFFQWMILSGDLLNLRETVDMFAKGSKGLSRPYFWTTQVPDFGSGTGGVVVKKTNH